MFPAGRGAPLAAGAASPHSHACPPLLVPEQNNCSDRGESRCRSSGFCVELKLTAGNIAKFLEEPFAALCRRGHLLAPLPLPARRTLNPAAPPFVPGAAATSPICPYFSCTIPGPPPPVSRPLNPNADPFVPAEEIDAGPSASHACRSRSLDNFQGCTTDAAPPPNPRTSTPPLLKNADIFADCLCSLSPSRAVENNSQEQLQAGGIGTLDFDEGAKIPSSLNNNPGKHRSGSEVELRPLYNPGSIDNFQRRRAGARVRRSTTEPAPPNPRTSTPPLLSAHVLQSQALCSPSPSRAVGNNAQQLQAGGIGTLRDDFDEGAMKISQLSSRNEGSPGGRGPDDAEVWKINNSSLNNNPGSIFSRVSDKTTEDKTALMPHVLENVEQDHDAVLDKEVVEKSQKVSEQEGAGDQPQLDVDQPQTQSAWNQKNGWEENGKWKWNSSWSERTGGEPPHGSAGAWRSSSWAEKEKVEEHGQQSYNGGGAVRAEDENNWTRNSSWTKKWGATSSSWNDNSSAASSVVASKETPAAAGASAVFCPLKRKRGDACWNNYGTRFEWNKDEEWKHSDDWTKHNNEPTEKEDDGARWEWIWDDGEGDWDWKWKTRKQQDETIGGNSTSDEARKKSDDEVVPRQEQGSTSGSTKSSDWAGSSCWNSWNQFSKNQNSERTAWKSWNNYASPSWNNTAQVEDKKTGGSGADGDHSRAAAAGTPAQQNSTWVDWDSSAWGGGEKELGVAEGKTETEAAAAAGRHGHGHVDGSESPPAAPAVSSSSWTSTSWAAWENDQKTATATSTWTRKNLPWGATAPSASSSSSSSSSWGRGARRTSADNYDYTSATSSASAWRRRSSSSWNDNRAQSDWRETWQQMWDEADAEQENQK